MTLPAWYAAYAVAASVIVMAGVAKVVRPHDTARALRRAGIPVNATLVRIGSGAEVVIGTAAVAVGGRAAAALLALSYLAFAAFVMIALARGLPLSTCGCFGEPDTPPTPFHVAIDLALALAAGLAVVHPVGGLPAAVAGHPGQGLVVVALVAIGAYLAVAALTLLPATTVAGMKR